MSHDLTTTLYTVLDQGTARILRVTQLAGMTLLQEFSPRGCVELELTAEGLQAFLRALPPESLAEAMACHQARWVVESRHLSHNGGGSHGDL